jgi:hypothetical protein
VTFAILQSRIPKEGDEVEITLVSANKTPLANVLVVNYGFTDQYGRITIVARQHDLVCINITGCVRCKGISMSSNGIIIAVENNTQGDPIEVTVVDDNGNPLPFTKVYANDTLIGETDAEGKVNATIYYTGKLTLKAEKEGYNIQDSLITIFARPNVCYLPFNVLPWIYVETIYTWILAVFAVIFMSITFFVMWKVMERKAITALIYALLPLGVFLFNENVCGWFSASLLLLILAVAIFELMAIFGMYVHERLKKKALPVPAKPIGGHAGEGGLYAHRKAPAKAAPQAKPKPTTKHIGQKAPVKYKGHRHAKKKAK